MTDLLLVLPDFDSKPFSHLLPSLDRNLLTTADILTLDAPDAAKRAQVPVPELRKLQDAVVAALHADLGVKNGDDEANNAPLKGPKDTISTLDEGLDVELGGGIPAGFVTEITGESGAGKTQFLLTLLLSSQLSAPHGLSRAAVYISTEAALATTRLAQLLKTHPRLAALPPKSKPSLSRILGIQTPDLESQDHILRYQLPVAIQKHDVGLVVLDSVAANYRAEFERPESKAGGAAMAKRSGELTRLGALLRETARKYNVAVVVANQVADRFTPLAASRNVSEAMSRTTSHSSHHLSQKSRDNSLANLEDTSTPPLPSQTAPLVSRDPLTLDHQQRWFTGWGDDPSALPSTLKTPSLGLVWTNQIAARIALLKQPVYEGYRDEEGGSRDIKQWRRWMKVVFAPWAQPSDRKGREFRILGTGLSSVVKDTEKAGEKEQEDGVEREKDDE
ncbi:P-loop containing nucleoside triphosphate hydrolase protein [Saccharata proteae CBS 121410]|uniref:P-loop containing nucleoside triphosphate hydrolase protein n=1 Tax=Saccharata proteae CBS 121410 TaxID=1314787 RepID=A0A9P4HRN8_9PEZI|nr:P-loop containing nucleoside triphosphate hydrolase protein [Saccharata proteae CBS 121410]